MANYTSHAIMSEQLYNKLINKNIAKINIDKNEEKFQTLLITSFNLSAYISAAFL